MCVNWFLVCYGNEKNTCSEKNSNDAPTDFRGEKIVSLFALRRILMMPLQISDVVVDWDIEILVLLQELVPNLQQNT
jgi:hypothetical protein